MTDISGTISFVKISEAFKRCSFFDEKTWCYAPEPWQLNDLQKDIIKRLGSACYQFYKAQELLYRKSRSGKSIARNREVYVPWVADYIDRGKPDFLIEHGVCSQQGSLPLILRPDLLITGNAFALTELDAVPGGFGLTAFLYRLYGQLKQSRAMLDSFYQNIRSLSQKELPVIAFAVSEESATYKPELQWVASELKALGYPVYCASVDDVYADEDGIHFQHDSASKRIDILYRFFELFDFKNIPCLEDLMQAEKKGSLVVTPPLKAYQEEKLSLALLHHNRLSGFWEEQLGVSTFEFLKTLVPRSWVLDFEPVPPSSVIQGPLGRQGPLYSWDDLQYFSKKERELVIKISGFHETAWGARSVTVGSDVSAVEWAQAIQQAHSMHKTHLHILQDFQKPTLNNYTTYRSDGQVELQKGRVRICPYYITNNQKAEYLGALATICPGDKKIIHGMQDAVLTPCV